MTVPADDAPRGARGERMLVTGDLIGMRLWQEQPVGASGEPRAARDYETVGYVVSGRARLEIAGSSVELGPGDSWVVPRGVEHRYDVIDELTAVEATSPPAPGDPAAA